MDLNSIITCIGSLGFPIVVAMYMIYVNQEQQKTHSSEVKEMTGAITELKLVIQKLLDKMKED